MARKETVDGAVVALDPPFIAFFAMNSAADGVSYAASAKYEG